MKRTIIALVVLVSILTGCQTKTEEPALSKEDRTFRFETDRTQAFGTFDYTDISENESLDLLKNKFKLVYPGYLKEVEAMGKNQLIVGNSTFNYAKNSITVRDKNLTFYSIRTYSEGDEFSTYTTVEWQYNYLESIEKARLENQFISVYNSTADGTFHGKELSGVLQDLGKMIQINDLDSHIDEFEKTIKKNEDQLTKKTFYVYDNKKEVEKRKGIRRALYVEYGDNNTIKMIQAVVNDTKKLEE